MNISFEDMKKVVDDNPEIVAKIQKHTTELQDVDYGQGRTFKSYVVKDIPDKEDVYCSIDLVDMEESISHMVEGMDHLKDMFESIRKEMDMLVAFATTVSKSSVSIRVVRTGKITSSVQYINVKTADDFMKLVSYHTPEFVDPLLKDYNEIKAILGA